MINMNLRQIIFRYVKSNFTFIHEDKTELPYRTKYLRGRMLDIHTNDVYTNTTFMRIIMDTFSVSEGYTKHILRDILYKVYNVKGVERTQFLKSMNASLIQGIYDAAQAIARGWRDFPLIPEQPMPAPTGNLFHFDYVYTTGVTINHVPVIL